MDLDPSDEATSLLHVTDEEVIDRRIEDGAHVDQAAANLRPLICDRNVSWSPSSGVSWPRTRLSVGARRPAGDERGSQETHFSISGLTNATVNNRMRRVEVPARGLSIPKNPDDLQL